MQHASYLDCLQNQSIRVEKIGGDDSFQMRQTLQMLTNRSDDSQDRGIYIFSAFKDSLAAERSDQWNTTDLLIGLAEAIRLQNPEAMKIIETLREKYEKTLLRELGDHPQKETVLDCCQEEFEGLASAVQHAVKEKQSPNQENDYSIHSGSLSFSLMGWGEMLVSKLYSKALERENGWVDTYAPDSNTQVHDLRNQIAQKAMNTLSESSIAFVPGYSGNLDGGLFQKVGRGYSDWTAANLYAAIRKNNPDQNIVFMLKKMFPLSSADPRNIKDVEHLTHISYRLLLEMIDPSGADAGFVNRAAATPEIFRNNGSMKVYTESGNETLITLNGPENPPEGIQFIQSRRVQKICIRSYHMNQNGYFAFVTGFLTQAGCSIIDDSSDASTINLMVAIDKKEGLQKESERFDIICSHLTEALRNWEEDAESEVSVTHTSHSLIFCGGENIHQVGVLSEITRILAGAEINLGPVIQTDQPKVIVFGVENSEELGVVQRLHAELITKKQKAED